MGCFVFFFFLLYWHHLPGPSVVVVRLQRRSSAATLLPGHASKRLQSLMGQTNIKAWKTAVHQPDTHILQYFRKIYRLAKAPYLSAVDSLVLRRFDARETDKKESRQLLRAFVTSRKRLARFSSDGGVARG